MSELTILDAHIHAFPNTRGGRRFMVDWVGRDEPPWLGTLEEVKAVRAEAGVRHSNVMMLTATGVLFRRGLEGLAPDPSDADLEALGREILLENRSNNLWATEMSAREEGFSCFCGVDPVLMSEAQLLGEVEEMLGRGALGVKLAPVWVDAYGDDPRLDPLWDYCESREIPVLTQAGSHGLETAAGALAFGHPRPFGNALKRFPRLRIIFAHLASGAEDDLAELTRSYPHVYTDLSLRLREIQGGERTPQQMVELLRSFGIERVVFASNFPLDDTRQTVETFRRLPLSDVELEQVAHRNFRTFLGERATQVIEG